MHHSRTTHTNPAPLPSRTPQVVELAADAILAALAATTERIKVTGRPPENTQSALPPALQSIAKMREESELAELQKKTLKKQLGESGTFGDLWSLVFGLSPVYLVGLVLG